MPLAIVRHDITKMRVDAIVNAANINLAQGGGVCGAIFTAAGERELQAACAKLAPIQTGDAVVTPGFKLPAKYVIHTAGPHYQSWNKEKSEELLHSCYRNALSLAIENGCKSIAFPLISSGIYGYPKDEALRVATTAIQGFLLNCDSDLAVTLVVFDKAAFTVSRELFGKVAAYIDEHYVDKQPRRRDKFVGSEESVLYSGTAMPPPPSAVRALSLDDIIGKLDEPFSAALLRLIDAKGKTDVDVYKRANLDRKLFSKIRHPDYRPSKKTVVALCVALELTLDETDDLLECAGFALSHSVKFDVIVEFFIVSGKYDIFEINNMLFDYDQPLLGG
jgi:O-acetyl-ADP-ribose deacetylase (regulator of RNase III)